MAKKCTARSEDFKAPEGRLSFARDLFKPRQQKNGKEKYGCTLIFPKAERKFFELLIAKVILDEWGPAGIERAKKNLIKSPILAGDGKEAHNKTTGELNGGMGPDVIFMRPTANGDRPPFVWYTEKDIHGKPKMVDESVAYSGCYGKAILHFYAWNNEESGDMVSVGISGFQKMRDGERLAGGGPMDVEKWDETFADEGPAPNVGGGGAGNLFGE